MPSLAHQLDHLRYSLIYEDEAHRATGNYSYTNIIKHMEKINIGYRIIGLSATPGNTI